MNALELVEKSSRKTKLPDVQTGDTVKVHQMIREGAKQRVQIFEGVVIRRQKLKEVAASITVRKIASGVGVEKTWFLHSPNVVKIEILRRAKVRRAFLGYMRGLRGKAARMSEQDFDRLIANEADGRTDAQIAAEKEAELAESAAAADKTAEDAEVAVSSSDDVLSQPDTESIDEVVRGENKAAAKQDAENDPDAQDDESLAEKTEVEIGEAKADPKE